MCVSLTIKKKKNNLTSLFCHQTTVGNERVWVGQIYIKLKVQSFLCKMKTHSIENKEEEERFLHI